MAQSQYAVGTELKTPFGTTLKVSDPNQFFSEQYVPVTPTAPVAAPSAAPVTNPVPTSSYVPASSPSGSLTQPDRFLQNPSVPVAPPTPDRTEIRKNVESTTATLPSNANFVNAAFVAYHGRDANASELARFVGMSVENVRNQVRAGSPVASLREQPTETQIHSIEDLGGKDLRIPVSDETDFGETAFYQQMTQLYEQSVKDTAAREKEREGLIAELKKGFDMEAGKAQRQIDLERDLGVTKDTQDLKEINLRIASKMAGFQAGEAKILEQPIPAELLYGQQAALQRQSAIEIGTLQMQAQVLQGNIRLAQDIAQRTVDLEFAPIEAGIKQTMAFLDLNSADLSRADQRQTENFRTILELRKEVVAQKKQDRQFNLNMAMNVALSGGDPSLIDPNKSPEENIATAAPFMFLKMARENFKTEVIEADGRKKLINSLTGETISDLGQATGSPGQLVIGQDANGKPAAYIFDPINRTMTPAVVSLPGLPGNTGNTPAIPRTDRNNNPIAFAVANGGSNEFTKALDAAGIKWSYGDAFPNDPSMVTVRIAGANGDGFEAARVVLSKTGAIENWYLNHTGSEVLTKLGIKNSSDFARASKDVQDAAIAGIYLAENGTPATPDNSTTIGAGPNAFIPAPSASSAAGQGEVDKVRAALLPAESIVSVIRGLTKSVITADNFALAALQGVKLTATAGLNINKDAKLLASDLEAFKGIIARALGEKGTLTENDIKRVAKTFPSFFDTQEIALGKLDTLIGLFNAIKTGNEDIYLKDKFGVVSSNNPLGLK